MQQTLSGRASALYVLLCQEYVRSGYRYSGSVSLDFVASRLGFSQEAVHSALSELMAASLVQRHGCKAARWELAALVRYQLLFVQRPSEQWEQQAPHFYPNGTGGEVERVIDEVAQLCRGLVGKLIQVRTASPLTTSEREAFCVVFPSVDGAPIRSSAPVTNWHWLSTSRMCSSHTRRGNFWTY